MQNLVKNSLRFTAGAILIAVAVIYGMMGITTSTER